MALQRSASPFVCSSSTSLKKGEEPTCLKAAWELMEIFYMDKQSQAWIPERLVDWLTDYDSLFTSTYETIPGKLVDFQKDLVNILREIENEKLKLEQVHLSEENSGLHVQNLKLSEEASYAKELASAAAVELKNLAGEVTKLSLQNAKLEKELMAARDLATRSAVVQTVNGVNRKYSDARSGRNGRISSRANC